MGFVDIIITCIEWCIGIIIGATLGFFVLMLEVIFCKSIYGAFTDIKKMNDSSTSDKKKGKEKSS
jgi:hypothetical protein